jgi:RimJ/RimL family protein N-acetyltransferase
LEPLDAHRHAADLWQAWISQPADASWTYLPYGPFSSESHLADWMRTQAAGADLVFQAIVAPDSGRALGWISWMRITPEAGSIEIGHVAFSPALKRTRAATEAIFLMLQECFRLGYRRVEWKCDALNAPSRAAAERLGFQFEGLFRQALVYKGRNRDTAWYSILDREWSGLEAGFLEWLKAGNFSPDGSQRQSLRSLTNACQRASI